MRRYVASSGTVAILGPLALLSLLLLPGSVAVDATDQVARSVNPTVDPAVDPAADPAALLLLDRAAHAPETVTYRGVQFVSAWTRQGSTGLVVEVVHRPGSGTTVRSDGTATTPPSRTYLPEETTEPSLLADTGTLSLLSHHFDLGLDRQSGRVAGRVAGRTADVVVATRPGADRPAARFWIDRDTGLVLRREVYDEHGRATRASAFVDITIGGVAADSDSADDGSAQQEPDGSADPTTAWPNVMSTGDLDAMRGRGWNCPAELPPSLQLVDARRGGGDYDGIVHLSYSDGLASVSVFEQRGRLQADQLDGYRATTVRGRPVYVRDGVPQRIVWSAHGTVFMVVADASTRTVGDVVVALPHAKDRHGAWQRLGRGLDRVASWFNPFE